MAALKPEEPMVVELAPETLRELMAGGHLKICEFRCRRPGQRQLIRRWCLEQLRERLR